MKKSAQPEQDPLQGVIIAAITPRRPGEISIDVGAMFELLDFLGHSGANAIALFGSTGEFLHFGLDDRRHMTALAAKRSRLPLLVNVSHSTLDGAVELAGDAVSSGAAGLLLMPPYYFRYSQESIFNFYLDFAAHMRGEAPVYLYNIPAFTNEIEAGTAVRLLDSGQFAGIKDSGGSWEYFLELREQAAKKPCSILVGSDGMYSRARAAGARGVVSGVASAVPELMLAIEAAVDRNEQDRIEMLNTRLREFIERMLRFPLPVAIKEAVRQRGINSGANAIELGGQERERMDEFRSWFGTWLPAVLGECEFRVERSSGR